ncbi:MAG: hypothetical protein JNK04_19990 [Myxococcales bacterium]|nr:hypothetical protein [Myxococcales bacterium]
MSQPKGRDGALDHRSTTADDATAGSSGDQPDGNRRAADAFARRSSTTTRVAALVANAGLACQFQSILSDAGLPVAEMAMLYASIGDRPHGESTILRATGPAQLAKAAAGFRRRAAAEFAAAGLPPDVSLYLPYYCVMPGTDAVGETLVEALNAARLPPSRAIAELLVPPSEPLATANIEQAAALKAAGMRVSLRVADADERALAAARDVQADFAHVVRPPRTFDDATQLRLFIAAIRDMSEVIIGGVEGPDDASLVQGLGVSLFSGDGIAAPRFLC